MNLPAADDALALSDTDFLRVRTRALELAGLAISGSKRTLVVSRLSPRVRDLGLDSFAAYLDMVEGPDADPERQAFVNALTTNVTRFFREEHHFDHLVRHVERLLANPPRHSPDGRPRLRIWSAGCSTGQEPYSIAASLLSAHPQLRDWDLRILATDIDTDVIARACRGRYRADDIAELSLKQAALFPPGGGGMLQMPAEWRRLITFKPLNLLDHWPMRGPFDAVFCRNVAIYFDKPTQTALFTRLAGVLAAGGTLYIGHSENLGAAAARFQPAGTTAYCKPAAAGRAAA